MTRNPFPPPGPDSRSVSRENLEEIQRLCQDALEDAVLMGCNERQFKQVLGNLLQQLKNPYGDKAR